MPLPDADNAYPDVPAASLQLRQQKPDEVGELIRALPGGDTATNTEDYINDVVTDDDVTTSQHPTDFLVGPVQDDHENPDAETDLSSGNSDSGDSGSTELVDHGSSSTSGYSSAGTEEISLAVPVAEVMRTLAMSKRFFEERGRQFDHRFVLQLSPMLSAVETQQACIAVSQAYRQSHIRVFFQTYMKYLVTCVVRSSNHVNHYVRMTMCCVLFQSLWFGGKTNHIIDQITVCRIKEKTK